MSDFQRRIVCRIAFVLVCLVPTLVVAQWILFPESIARWQIEARSLLGWPVEIGAVSTPTPQQTVLHSFRVRDPHHHAWLDLRDVYWTRNGSRERFELHDITVSADQFSEFMRNWCSQIAKFDAQGAPIEVCISGLTLYAGVQPSPESRTVAFELCLAQIEPATGEMSIEFHSKRSSEAPIRWQVTAGGREKSWRWSLQTNKHLLPGWAVARLVPVAKHVGENWSFTGFIAGESLDDSTAIEIRELQIVDVDPRGWFANSAGELGTTDQPMIELNDGARCVIDVRSGQIRNGRIEYLHAVVHCDAGVRIQGQWLNAAKKWLRLELPEQTPFGMVSLQGIAFGLEIGDARLAILGQRPNDLIARDLNNEPLVLATTDSKNLPPYCLAGWIADRGETGLPISEASLRVLSRLPLVR